MWLVLGVSWGDQSGKGNSNKGGDKLVQLYVGIDIGSKLHHVAVFTESGEVIKRDKIVHRMRDISRFIEELKTLKEKHSCTDVFVGMENSNGYAAPLDRMLIHSGFKVIAINSITIDKYRNLVGQPRKDDPYDAELIGSYLIDIYHSKGIRRNAQEIGSPDQASMGKLRALTRHFRTTKRDLTRANNRLKKHLLGYFPDFLEAFENIQTKTARALLRHYDTVSKVKRARASSIAKIRISSRRTVGPKAASKLKALVKEIHYLDPLENEMGIVTSNLIKQMGWLIDQLEELGSQIEEMAAELSSIQEITKTVPGAGIRNTAELVAEIGDVRRFSTRDKLGIYCGIGCLNRSSGKKVAARKPTQINHRAKSVLCMMAQAAIVHDDTSRRYYDKKRGEGKSHWHAIKCLAKYLLRRIYLLLNSVEAHDAVTLLAA